MLAQTTSIPAYKLGNRHALNLEPRRGVAMLTTTTITDTRSAVEAISEAAILSDNYTAGPSVLFEHRTGGSESVTVFGLCVETYPACGEYGDPIRVHHTEDREVPYAYAWVEFTLDPTADWIPQIESIVDWLATESPVPA